MKKKIVEKIQPEKKWNETIYIAEDGREFAGFDGEKNCISHEKHLAEAKIFKKIEKIILDNNVSETVGRPWYHLTTEEEIETFKKICSIGTYTYYNSNESKNFKFEIGGWYSYYIEDGGDYADELKIYYLEEEVEKVENYLKALMAIKNNKDNHNDQT